MVRLLPAQISANRGEVVMHGLGLQGYVPPQPVARNLTERQHHILALLDANRQGLPLREIRTSLSGAAPESEV